MLQYNLQKIPVLDPSTRETIDSISRDIVHANGYWHSTIQTFVFRLKDNKVQTLVQKRSSFVDIGKNKIDQSLATHKYEGESNMDALKRGFYEEFSLDLTDFLIAEVFPDYHLSISKTYRENHNLKNRELINLFFVLVPENIKCIPSVKTNRFFWMDWENYLYYTQNNHDLVTKTSRFYVENIELLDAMKKRLTLFLNKKIIFDKKQFKKNIHFYSIFNKIIDENIECMIETDEENIIPNIYDNYLNSNINDSGYDLLLSFDNKFGRIPQQNNKDLL